MTKISDEIRSFVKRSYADEYMDPRELLAIADRIDREMVELPKDADYVPIHVGDTVWDMRNWKKLSVIDIVMGAHEVRLYVTPDETVEWYVNPRTSWMRGATAWTWTGTPAISRATSPSVSASSRRSKAND